MTKLEYLQFIERLDADTRGRIMWELIDYTQLTERELQRELNMS